MAIMNSIFSKRVVCGKKFARHFRAIEQLFGQAFIRLSQAELKTFSMSLSTRLILLLAVLVGAVMALGGWYILRQRVAILETATRNELHAHALTLRIALGDAV